MLGLFTVNYAVVQLYRETIIDQALELLDAYGLADMTMRRVASSLGVAAGALYWHIANKQELITAVAHKIITPVFALADGLAITAESEPTQQLHHLARHAVSPPRRCRTRTCGSGSTQLAIMVAIAR